MRRQRARRSVGGLVGGLLLLILLFAIGAQLYLMQDRLAEARQQDEALTKEIAEVSKENEFLEESIEKSSDPEMIERIAREELDMACPNEKVFYSTGG